ncbi:hypothetical protein JYU34_010114 [Plutella xylostella]|uniref:Uncharacterized protein n=1 Tax=Plutella xylostella TaxID=51655 RepID=A0ABQ7QIK8_PLUXY|nr:hypothetical protein JYU34_010114 [Plutella xylostella]
MKEEFNGYFDEEEEKADKPSSKKVLEEKYEELKRENETLQYELAGYKNESYMAKEEAERKFEKFKAQFIAQQALQGSPQVFPPLPPTPDQKKPIDLDDEKHPVSGIKVPTTEARLISVITAFLLVHPLGASVDYIVSYVRSILPRVNQTTVSDILQKYDDVFAQTTTGVGASIERRWTYITFDTIKAKS